MKKFVSSEYKYTMYKLGLIFALIMLFLVVCLLLTENSQWSISIPFIALLSLFYCFVVFRSLKLGIYIDGENIFKQGIFIKKRIDIYEIKVIKIAEYAVYAGHAANTISQKDRHGNQLYSAVFMREIIPDLKEHYNDMDIMMYHRKKVMFKTIYDREAINYILTLNPDIKLL